MKKLFGGLQTDYLDGFQYKFTYSWEDETGTMTTDGMKLRIIPTAEGYFDGLRNRYFYNYTDHLGNIRLSYSDADANGEVTGDIVVNNCQTFPDGSMACNNYIIPGEAEGANNYYPFGLMHNAQANNFNNAYQYKYNGKELQETGMYDYGARFYMPDIGRWGVVDPLAGKHPDLNPMMYANNNPIIYIDPDGMDCVEAANGNITWRDDVTADNYQNKGVLKKGEIYRGTSYERKKIWSNVNVRGNTENGLIAESYGEDGKMTYKNLTPWVDKAFEEMAKGISETGNNPEITKYWKYTQMAAAAANGDKWAQSVLKEDQTPWFAAFVNYNLETSGVDGTMFATAYSFKNYGQDLGNDKPVYGAIAVMNYSHVGIVVGTNKDGRIILLGGNQGNAVNLSPNGQSAVVKYVYPNGHNPTSIALPQYDLKGRSLTNSTSR